MSLDQQKLAQVFANNLGNKITVELANGMIGEILKAITDNVDNTTADTKSKKQHHEPLSQD